MSVPINVSAINIRFEESDIHLVLTETERMLREGRVSQGRWVEELELRMAQLTGAPHSLAVSNGTVALELAFKALGLAGRRVAIPANTNFATYIAAVNAGARVALIDIDLTTLSPSLNQLKALYLDTSSQSDPIAAVVLVHMGGIISREILEIQSWCRANNIALVEDCAHAHGCSFEGVHAGMFGDAGCFSFFATKVVTSGEGGLIVTNSKQLETELRYLRNLGKKDLWRNYHERLGTNGRISEFNALLGAVQVARIDEIASERARLAERYCELLGHESLPITIVKPSGSCSWYKFVILLPKAIDRDALRSKLLTEHGIQMSGCIYEYPLHQQPILAPLHTDERYPFAEDFCSRHMCLPLWPGLSYDAQKNVVDAFTQELGRCLNATQVRC